MCAPLAKAAILLALSSLTQQRWMPVTDQEVSRASLLVVDALLIPSAIPIEVAVAKEAEGMVIFPDGPIAPGGNSDVTAPPAHRASSGLGLTADISCNTLQARHRGAMTMHFSRAARSRQLASTMIS